jgi:uncharacterized secreted protein with C-terminal beta-propeller domain
MKFNFNVLSKKHLITFFAFVLVSCSSLAQSSKEQEVLSLSEKKFKWMINLNMDSLENILDENVMYVHSNGWSQNKHEIIEDFKTKKLVLNKIEILETKIRNFENTYVVNGVGIIAGEIDSNPFSVKLNYSEVYVYKNRKYFLFSRHANKIN